MKTGVLQLFMTIFAIAGVSIAEAQDGGEAVGIFATDLTVKKTSAEFCEQLLDYFRGNDARMALNTPTRVFTLNSSAINQSREDLPQTFSRKEHQWLESEMANAKHYFKFAVSDCSMAPTYLKKLTLMRRDATTQKDYEIICSIYFNESDNNTVFKILKLHVAHYIHDAKRKTKLHVVENDHFKTCTYSLDYFSSILLNQELARKYIVSAETSISGASIQSSVAANGNEVTFNCRIDRSNVANRAIRCTGNQTTDAHDFCTEISKWKPPVSNTTVR